MGKGEGILVCKLALRASVLTCFGHEAQHHSLLPHPESEVKVLLGIRQLMEVLSFSLARLSLLLSPCKRKEAPVLDTPLHSSKGSRVQAFNFSRAAKGQQARKTRNHTQGRVAPRTGAAVAG
eukprot:1159726-Pelagomonas_calceolata.AAC.4